MHDGVQSVLCGVPVLLLNAIWRGCGVHVFIADDNEQFAEVLRRIATKEGWEATVCSDGRILSDKVAESHEPVLLIIDINMPEMDGIEVINELRRIRRKMRIRFITGGLDTLALAARMMAKAQGLETGRFIMKPVSGEDFKEILKEEKVLLYGC